MASSLSRRDFLRTSGLVAGGVAGLSLFGGSLEAHGGTALSGAGIFLEPSSPGEASAAFVAACDRALAERAEAGGPASLDRTLARLWSRRPVRLYSPAEADRWLHGNGYLASLEHFFRNGGCNVVLFQELNVFGEPQFSTDPRTLAYLAHALRERAGGRALSILFPGPAAARELSTGTWLNGLWEYFVKYDLLAGERSPRTLGQVYQGSVAPAVADRTMLWHSGRGLFDGVAWHADEPPRVSVAGGSPRTSRQMTWVRDKVDPSLRIYFTEAGRPVRTDPDSSVALLTPAGERMRSSFRSAGPFQFEAA